MDIKKKWNVRNPSNRLVTIKDIDDILKKGSVIDICGKVDGDISIWQKAFVHKSYVKHDDIIQDKNIIPLQPFSNERLEWLGDAQIQGSVSSYLWKRYPCQDEGFLTKLRSKLVKTDNLSFLASRIGLAPHILLSYHVEFSCQGRTNSRILENTFEAFIGAMFVYFEEKKDSSYAYNIVKTFIVNIIEKYVDMVEKLIKDDNAKDQLMWYFQKHFNGSFPIYKKDKYEQELFYIIIYEPETTKIVGKGDARSKKQAEQNAAKNALGYYAAKDIQL